MIYRVKVENRIFTVEIKNIDANPVIAVVDGEEIEIWPYGEGDTKAFRVHAPEPARAAATGSVATKKNGSAASDEGVQSASPNPGVANASLVQAPIPGVIFSVAVHPGDQVNPGEELCVIEAMKMKNVIRATRSGTIAAVQVSPGQAVQHRDVLIEYA